VRIRWSLLFAAALFSLGLASVLGAAPRRSSNEPTPFQECLLSAGVGSPSQMGSLVVYPIQLPTALLSAVRVDPIATAMAQGRVTVEEMPGRMDQYRLLASNSGGSDVFAQSGGFFQGGGQDRGGGRGFMMSPLGQATFPAYCFEEGRTEGPSSRFAADSFSLAHPVLRGLLAVGDQKRIWREVARERQTLEVADPACTSYRQVEEATRAKEARSRVELFSQDWGSGLSGIVVACGDRVIGLDLYGDPLLLKQHRTLLLRSYALVNAELADRVPCSIGPEAVAAFLRDAANARYESVPAVDLGESYGLAMRWHAGEALLKDARLVHLGMYDTRALTGR
jgi:hypothetical protein